MRKVLALLAALILALTTAAWFAQPASATGNGGEGHTPVVVCHATPSADNQPTEAYVRIVVDDDSTKLEGHRAHSKDVIGEPGDEDFQCPVIESPSPTPTSTQYSETPTPTPTETECSEDCETPTPTPTKTTPEPTQTTPTQRPTPTPTHSTTTPSTPSPSPTTPVLAHTGSSTPYLMGLGLATVLAGAALLAGGRRRKGSHI